MKTLQLFDFQQSGIQALREGIAAGHRSQMLYGPTGMGKCLRKGTLVVMASGSTKAVEDVVVGDLLLGPDGGARKVLALGRGSEQMYEVTPKKGDPYYVNASHILSLRKTPGSDGLILADGTRVPADADVVNVRVDVFAESNKTARHCLKGWRSGAVEFHGDRVPLLIDPYILGAWLGDGRSNGPAICKPLCHMVKAWQEYGASLGLKTSKYQYGDGCPEWALVGPHNPVRDALHDLGLIGNKHIPLPYKCSSVGDRLRLIAGLLDSDGHAQFGGYDWISKSEKMARDFAFVCRSVGLAAYVSRETKSIASTGFSGEYFRVSVSGDCERIPCLDKPVAARTQKKRHLVVGIEVRPIGVEDYYGFTIDGDSLFLLGDFTVTHNTEVAMALLQAAERRGSRAAMVLDRRILVDQTSRRLDAYGIDHGVLMAGHWRYRPHNRIQICSAQTLEKRESFPGLDLMIVDEAHTVRQATADMIKARGDIKVIGLSASPFTDGLGELYSNVVSCATTEELVGMGRLVPLRVFLAKQIDMSGAKKVAGEWSQDEASERGIKIIGDVVSEWAKKTQEIFGGPRKTIVFCAGVEHGAALARQFAEAGYNFVSISYKDDDDFKAEAIKEFSKPDSSIHGLIATDILTKGFDVPDVMIGVSARPFSKSFASHVQQMGRVMRCCEGKQFGLWLDHSGNYLRFREDWEELYCDGVSELADGKEKSKPEPTEKEKQDALCPACGHIFPPRSDTCAHCGHQRVRSNSVIAVAGEMEEIDTVASKADRETKQIWYSGLRWICKERGYKEGWAANKYKEKFGVWPRKLAEAEVPPPPELIRWVKSRNIAWAKSPRR